MSILGVVGTGTMGCTAAERWRAAGLEIVGYDLSSRCVERGRQAGVRMCASLHELAVATRHIVLFLPGPMEIEATLCDPDGLLAYAAMGTIIIDMCTSAPKTTQAMSKKAALSGVSYLDAPVLGRPASIGNWALPVGGDPKVLEKCRPFLQHVATQIIHIGPSGSGHKVKLLNQMMFGAINAMTAEMMAVAEQVGIAPKLLYDTITTSRAGTMSNLFVELGRRVCQDDYDNPTFSVELLTKDVRLGLEMANEAGAVPLIGQTVDFLNKSARAKGFGAQDCACMWRAVRQIWQPGDEK